MLDSVTAKKVRSRRILFKSGSCEQYSGIISKKAGRRAASHDRLRATLREDGPDLPRITNGGLATREMGLIRAMHSRHRVRARWGYGDRNMDFATLPVMPNRQDVGEKNDIGRITLFAAEPTSQ
jgi:hypothetical protein